MLDTVEHMCTKVMGESGQFIIFYSNFYNGIRLTLWYTIENIYAEQPLLLLSMR